MKTKIIKLKFNKYLLAILVIVFLLPVTNLFCQIKEPKSTKSIGSVSAVGSVEKIDKIESPQQLDEINTGSEQTIHAKLDIDFRPKVTIEVYHVKTEIMPAKNNAVEVFVQYIAEARDKEDVEKLKKAMDKYLVRRIGDQIVISTRFYKSYISNMNTPVSQKITMVLKDNSKIKLTKFEINEFKIYVPTDLDLAIDAKYGKVDLDFSVQGDLEIKGYDIEMMGKSVAKNLDIEGKYSQFTFESAGKTQLNLYESKIGIKSLDKVKGESKYGHINIGKADNLDLKCYEDKIKVASVPNIRIDGKYCDIEIEENKNLEAILYEGTLKSNTTNRVDIQAKYLEAKFKNMKAFVLTDGYENKIDIETVDSIISKNGKYNEFAINKLEDVLLLDGYEEDIEIVQVSDMFEKLWIDGKYMELRMGISNKIPYKFYGDVQYPDFKVNKEDYKVVFHDKESSKLKFEYYKSSKVEKPEIRINGYEMDITINHN